MTILFASGRDSTIVLINSQVHVPLFFLLSGFCLTLRYGNKKHGNGPTQGWKCPQRKNAAKPFNFQEFWHGRLVRILPVYYATFALALILVPLGYGPDESLRDDVDMKIWGSFAALYGVQSWIMAFGFGPVAPAWTISTLFFFYILFPRQNSFTSYLLSLSKKDHLTPGF